ncbi:MAG: hypothetical protein AB7T27_12540 [Kiritimatiellia bacterium]
MPQTAKGQTTVYLHDFGTNTISPHPYTVAPGTFDANLSNSSWTNSRATWTNYTGSSGRALSLVNSSSTVVVLTFDVAGGYALSVTSFNFWCQRSTTGAQNWDMTINGISVGSGLIPTTGAAIGDSNVANAVNGQTGTVAVVLSLSGSTGAGSFRLDDFKLVGAVSGGATNIPPVMNAIPAQSATVGGADFEYTVTATQTDGDPILYFACTSAVDESTWLFDTNTGDFLFIPTTNEVGANVFSFIATDKDGESDPAAMTVTVSEASGPPPAPAAIWPGATNITDFTAAWSTVSGATGYRLDVSLHPAFVTTSTLLDEDFDGSTALPPGWTDWGTANNTDHESSYPNCRALSAVGGSTRLTTPSVNYPTQLTFFAEASVEGDGKTTTNYYSLDGGSTWSQIGTFTVDQDGVTNAQALTSSPNLSGSTGVMFRFVSAFSTWYVDDVKVCGVAEGNPSFIAGYSNRTVSGTSQSVTGLTADTTYYFRARAVSGEGTSGNSSTATVTTLKAGWVPGPFTVIGGYVSQNQALTFEGSTNGQYTLEYKAEISDAGWQEIRTDIRGTNATMTLIDTNARERAYYRVKAELYP